MAFQSEALSVVSYANGFTLWHYRTNDIAAEVDDEGYFNPAAKMVRPGDFILLNAGVGSLPTNGLCVVTANQNGTVDVANATAFGSINAD